MDDVTAKILARMRAEAQENPTGPLPEGHAIALLVPDLPEAGLPVPEWAGRLVWDWRLLEGPEGAPAGAWPEECVAVFDHSYGEVFAYARYDGWEVTVQAFADRAERDRFLAGEL